VVSVLIRKITSIRMEGHGKVEEHAGAMVGGLVISHNAANMVAGALVAAHGSEATTGALITELKGIKAMLTIILAPSMTPRSASEETKDAAEIPRMHDYVNIGDALQSNLYIGGKATKWFEEKGFGFVSVRGRDVFVHKDSIRLKDRLLIGSRIVMKVISDPSHGENKMKAKEVWYEEDYEAEQAMIATMRAAETAEKAAKYAAKQAERTSSQSAKLVEKVQTARMMANPPGIPAVTTQNQERQLQPNLKEAIAANASMQLQVKQAALFPTPEPPSIFIKSRESIFGVVRARATMEERQAKNQDKLDKARFAYEWHNRERGSKLLAGPRCKGLQGLLQSYASSWRPVGRAISR
jgi:cold shock CspA family protein